MSTPSQPQWSEDGQWRWDGHNWVPSGRLPAMPNPELAHLPSTGALAPAFHAVSPARKIAGFAVLAVVLMLPFSILAANKHVHLGPIGGVSVDPNDPVARSLQAAADAEETYKSGHGVYAYGDDVLSASGFDTLSGVTVHVVRADGFGYYCLQGTKGDETLYLSQMQGGVTTDPCW